MKIVTHLGFLALLLFSEFNYALEIIRFEDKTGRKFLLLQDCQDSAEKTCDDYKRKFYRGDADRLNLELKSNKFSQVWLNSRGGSLLEGMEIGRIFRKNKQYVRIPRGAHCASACTVAFLGGLLREVDAGASFEVHAYSRALADIPPISGMEIDPELTLGNLARERAKEAREIARDLMIYYQEMLNGEPNIKAIAAATIGKVDSPLPYLRDGRLQRDIARFHSEQYVVMQEIWMRMERESIALAIEDLKVIQATLGKRASAAIQILEIMFTSRITGRALLNETTLLEMGFVNVANIEK